MKTLREIAAALGPCEIHGDPETRLRGIQHDSRAVVSEEMFAVLRGVNTDGRLFVGDAETRGAAALLVSEPVESRLPQLRVPDVRAALGIVAAVLSDHPTEKMATVAVTGTNGKTTTVYLVEHALRVMGLRPGIMSTVTYRYGDLTWKAEHTTPEAPVIQSVARDISAAGATHLIMEASSHGLVQHRLRGCRFRVVAFTNLTQDHLDYHKDMAAYGAAKMLLFTEAIKGDRDARAVINIDDPFSSAILAGLEHPAVRVSVKPEGNAEIRPADPPRFDIDGIRVQAVTPDGIHALESPLIGAHNLSNLLLALGICISLGVAGEDACRALKSFGAPGRLERVTTDEPFAVLVDYAHTPDALLRVLASLKPLTEGRLICVFGCGGDRDTAKRPLMGEAVRKVADLAVVTSDNPRTEDPDAIIQMILPGVSGKGFPEVSREKLADAGRGFAVEGDRRTAIRLALKAAGPGDTVLIAGKGHEDYQILGKKKIHFDDREEAKNVLVGLRGGSHG